jgi:hypothetical protein
MPPELQDANLPHRKISEAFLDFASPLLDPLGAGATDDQLDQALKIAFTVWNAVVYETVNGNTRYVEMVRQLTAHDMEMAAFTQQLIARKRQLFGDDHRLIGEYKLTRKDGELRLRAEARDPRSTK